MFGASKTTNTLFGAAAKPAASPFGQTGVGLGNTGQSLFTGAPQTNTVGWGAGPTASTSAAVTGTSVAFNPPITQDTIQRGGQSTQVNAKNMCITAMKEYHDYSFEELRLGDYGLNRKAGATATAGTASMFGGAANVVKPFQFSAAQPAASTGSIFGQTSKPANSLFGGPGTMSFGSGTSTTTQSVFGQSAQQQGGLLGLKTQFGAATQPTNLFGATPAAQTTGGFAFGQTTQTNSIFGTKPLFGAPSTGTAAPTAGLFGATQPATATVASTGFAFGQTQQPTAAVATGLGAGTTTNLFGQPATSLGAGAKPTLFGSQPATASPFGSNTANLFGVAKTTATPSLFGAPSTGLTTTQPQQAGFGFGAAKPAGTTGLFGAPTTLSTAAKPGGIFGMGATTNTTPGFGFGAGQTTAQPTGAFGSAFGTSPATTNVGLFGQTAVSSGLAAAKKPFGFGTTGLATNPVAPAGGFGFGQTNTAAVGAGGTGLFGTGTAGTTGFGLGATSTATSGGLFGTTGAFGAKPTGITTGFGTGFGLGASSLAAPGTGLTGGGIFGTGSTGFGSLTNTTQSLGGGLGGFGLTQPGQIGGAQIGLANNSTEQMAQNVRAQQQVLELVRSMPYGQSPLFRYLNMPTASDAGSDEANKSVIGGLSNSTYAGSGACASTGLGSNATVPAKAVANALAERHRAAGFQLGTGSPGSSNLTARTGMWMRPRAGTQQRLLHVSNRSKLFSGFHEDDAFPSPSDPNASPVSRLRRSNTLANTDFSFLDSPGLSSPKGNFFVRKDEWKRLHLPESVRSSIMERSAASSHELSQLAEAYQNTNQDNHNEDAHFATSMRQQSRDPMAEDSDLRSGDGASGHPARSLSRSVSQLGQERSHSAVRRPISPPRLTGLGMARAREALQTSSCTTPLPGDSVLLDDLESTWTAPTDVLSPDRSLDRLGGKSPSSDKTSMFGQSPSSTDQSFVGKGIRLTKPGYYTLPIMSELAAMLDENGRCVVEDFVIGRRHYGHILFPGLTDVTDEDLDSVVHIRRREVVVYPDDEKKPQVGQGLNKQAEVCLESIWPTDKSSREPIKAPERLAAMRFEERLERATRRMDARFIEYRPESGSWVFEVKHFSKYRLEDSDDEGGDNSEVVRTVTKGEEKTIKPTPMGSSHSMGMSDDMELTRPSLTLPTHRQPQLRAVSNLIHEVDKETCFNPLDLEMNATARSPTTSRPSIPQTSSRTLEQHQPRLVSGGTGRRMREAFFSPISRDNSQRRSVALFGRDNDDDDEDEADEMELASMATDGAPIDYDWTIPSTMGTKRLPAYSPTDPVVFQSPGWTAGKRGLGPTPTKLSRTQPAPFGGVSKLEPMSDSSDISSDDYPSVPLATPFRPIPFERYSCGVPLREEAAPSIHSGLRCSRIAPELKLTNRPFSSDGLPIQTGEYPYAALRKLFVVGKSSEGISQNAALDRLSHLVLDAGLCRGHGLRPSWGQNRAGDSHCMALITPIYATDEDGRGDNGSSLCLRTWPSLIEQADETLLNAALTASICPDRDDHNEENPLNDDATLRPPSDHCPLWKPQNGLAPLEAYSHALHCAQFSDLFTPAAVNAQQTDHKQFSGRMLAIRRLVSLCLALWGRHPQETEAKAALARMRAANVKPQMGEDTDVDNEDEDDDDCMDISKKSYLKADEVKLMEDAADDDNDEVAADNEPPAVRAIARKQAVSEWIRAQSYPWLESRLMALELFDLCGPGGDPMSKSTVNVSKTMPTGQIAEGLFACLLAGEPGAACRLAMAARMHDLVALIAQSSTGDPVVRRGLQHQLALWHELKYDKYFPIELLRVYALLAGLAHFPHPKQPGVHVSVLERVDWIRVFGAYLWYLTDYTMELTQVLSTYSWGWHSSTRLHLMRPMPPKLHALLDPLTPLEDNQSPPGTLNKKQLAVTAKNWSRDTAYHLLQLFCKRAHSLERTLNPCSISSRQTNHLATTAADPTSLLDWAASFALWRILDALGLRHYSDQQTPSRICTEFASQLEDAGLWEWSVFVLLHQPCQTSRDASVKATLARHVSLVLPDLSTIQSTLPADAVPCERIGLMLDALSLVPAPPLTEVEQFVVGRLGVPVRWMHEAKAVLARHRFATYNIQSPGTTQRQSNGARRNWRLKARLCGLLEASHWFAAGHVGAAHEICSTYLLPNLVVHSNLSMRTFAPGSGPTTTMARLGHRLNRLIMPFRHLPEARLPNGFETGVGIYIMYSDVLSLAEQLAAVCQSRTIRSTDDDVKAEQEGTEGAEERETQAQLAVVLNNLHSELDAFTERLQRMPTPCLTTRVVKTEMAAACTQLASAFLAVGLQDSDPDAKQAALDGLMRQLIAMTRVELPADYCLRELSILSEAHLSMGLV